MIYNPYEVLGVSAADSKDVVKARYRALCRKYHPDNVKTGNSERFMEINKAWKCLEGNSGVAFGVSSQKYWRHKTTFTVEKA